MIIQTSSKWCQHHLIFTNNDIFSVLKLPPLSVLSLFSHLDLKSMQPFSISEPRWNKISVILSEWYYQIHKYNYTNTKIQVDKYKFTNKSQCNETIQYFEARVKKINVTLEHLFYVAFLSSSQIHLIQGGVFLHPGVPPERESLLLLQRWWWSNWLLDESLSLLPTFIISYS